MRPVAFRCFLAAIAVILSIGTARASAPVVAELFTSQSCSSCPPADALLAELRAMQPDILPLDFHVDYWNRLGWQDRFSFPEATRRQKAYAARLHTDVYTPQLVIGGTRAVIGSDRSAVMAALDAARAEAAQGPGLFVGQAGDGTLVMTVGGGSGAATLLLVSYDGRHDTHIGGGENSGQVLTEVNVVRSLAPVGLWDGTPIRLQAARPPGEHVAVLLQAPSGRILGAATAKDQP